MNQENVGETMYSGHEDDGWRLASGMTIVEILEDYNELEVTDIYAALSFICDRGNRIYQVAVKNSCLTKSIDI